jgi:transcriptional regulator GlxA family with amidase domain
MGLVRKGAQRRPYNVALVVFEGVELLDFAGPGEVFSAAMGPNGVAFEVWTVASSTQPVEANRAVLTVVPERSIADCPTPDLVVIPGGAGALTRDRPMMDWIKARAADSEVILSVCNGAMVLAQAGLLDRLEATTHVGMIDVLRRQAPKVRVVAGRRFVDNGKIVTSAGVSAGIDAALHLVGRLLGPEAALNTAKYMEYAWRPEQAATSSPSVPDR